VDGEQADPVREGEEDADAVLASTGVSAVMLVPVPWEDSNMKVPPAGFQVEATRRISYNQK